MQNKLRGWLTDNSVTSDPKDKILILDPAGNIGLPEIYAEMRYLVFVGQQSDDDRPVIE